MNNPALEYVKFITHVFSLDESQKDAVTRLKRNLLKLIRVRFGIEIV